MHGCVLGHPINVDPGVARRRVELQIVIVMDRRLDFRADPFMDFGVAITKGKPAGAVVITGRKIYDVGATRTVSAVGLRGKGGVINTVGTMSTQAVGISEKREGCSVLQ